MNPIFPASGFVKYFRQRIKQECFVSKMLKSAVRVMGSFGEAGVFFSSHDAAISASLSVREKKTYAMTIGSEKQ